ncbi:Kinase-like protein [Mycena chlorophos]|uniref:Kinase-like protein n=1 Tax=Mycena chlorophos TaxID=658473 RepID=A0A8H6SJ03_MYCCL|nr:Kinase-like protein [Mycena chlorophos]
MQPDLAGRTANGNRLYIEKLLGSGAQGIVTSYAMKTLSPGRSTEAELLYHRACAKGNETHILPFRHRVHITHGGKLLVGALLDLAEMDLGDYIDQPGGGFGLDSAALKAAFLHLLDAVSICHAKGVYHRDIKPANVLRSAAGDLLLADFGMCTPNTRSATYCGTAEYMSPEMLAGGEYSCAQSDLWALGITFLNMTSSSLEFPWDLASPKDRNYAEFLKAPVDVLAELYPISMALSALLARVFHPDPAQRPTLQQMKAEIERMETVLVELPADRGMSTPSGSSSAAGTPQDEVFDDYPWNSKQARPSSAPTSNASASVGHEPKPAQSPRAEPVVSKAPSHASSVFVIPPADDPAMLALAPAVQEMFERLRVEARAAMPQELKPALEVELVPELSLLDQIRERARMRVLQKKEERDTGVVGRLRKWARGTGRKVMGLGRRG